jgi:hypothetical protein
MTTPVTLRIRQQGYVRSNGYQATQWAVTVPVSDPPGDPPIATNPLSYAPLFVGRAVEGYESLERAATLQDFAALPVLELEYFDIRGNGGDSGLSSALFGDTLEITTSVPQWLQAQPPYDTQTFVVSQVAIRAQGSSARCLTNPQGLQLGSYVFTPTDVGRWVLLSGFTNPANNGWAQILSYVGNTAQVSRTFASTELIGNWQFPWLRIQTSFPGLEPRYFPSKERNLAWRITRGSTVASGTGGMTMRGAETSLFRTVRFTTLAPSLQAATDLFEVIRQDVAALQRSASLSGTTFTTLITYTVGP